MNFDKNTLKQIKSEKIKKKILLFYKTYAIHLNKIKKIINMKLALLFLSAYFLLVSTSPNNYIFLKTIAKKYDAVAAWVFDTQNKQIYQPSDNYPKFFDLINGMFLKQAGAKSLIFSSEQKEGLTIPYVDFTHTDNEGQASILFSRDQPLLEMDGSFTLITVYRKVDENGFRNGGFLSGKWEECDRSRSYSLFGNLADFGTNCITGQVSNTGFASPPSCTYAWEGVCSSQIPPDDSLWHTAAMVWNSNPSGQPSIENEVSCNQNAKSYDCQSDDSTCSYVEVFLDGVPGEKKYYNYKQVYQGSDSYVDKYGEKTNILRKALFTVGGTAAKHWKQPDHRENGKLVSDITLFGRNFWEHSKQNYVSGDWRDDFIVSDTSYGEWDPYDFFVRSRFGGHISAVIVLNRALQKEQVEEFHWKNIFKN